MLTNSKITGSDSPSRAKRVDISEMLRLGEDTNQMEQFDPLAAMARQAMAESEWAGLSRITERERQVSKAVLILLMKAKTGRLDVDTLIWWDFVTARSVDGWGASMIRDMYIADRNRATDERSGWTRAFTGNQKVD